MKPRQQLAEIQTPQGQRLALYAHDGHYQIRLDGRELMNSFVHASEVELGARLREYLSERETPRVLIGGLGLGFTLRAVLEWLPTGGSVVVAELFPAVIEWNRIFLGELNGQCLDDARVEVFTGDVAELLTTSPAASWDGVLLDVDNGPVPMVAQGNARLYERDGLQRLKTVLRPGGVAAFWSANDDRPFLKRLRQAGYGVDAVPAKAYPGAKRANHVIYFARP